MTTTSNEQLLRLADVSKATTLGKSTINLWVSQGKFPAPLMLSKTIKVWRRCQIDAWIGQYAEEGESNGE